DNFHMNLSAIFRNAFSIFSTDNQRSKLVVKNVYKSLIVKVFSTLITLSLISVSIKYIDKQNYGVWLTLASVVTWLSVFDFGLSNGLTNRLSEAFAKGDCKLAKIYLSTTYFILIIFSIPIL